MVRGARPRPRVGAVVRGPGHERCGGRRTARALARTRPGALPRRRAQLREPHDRFQEQGVPELRAQGERPARAAPAAPPRRQAQAARLLLPTQRPLDRRGHPRVRAARARGRVTASRTRAWPRCWRPPGSRFPPGSPIRRARPNARSSVPDVARPRSRAPARSSPDSGRARPRRRKPPRIRGRAP